MQTAALRQSLHTSAHTFSSSNDRPEVLGGEASTGSTRFELAFYYICLVGCITLWITTIRSPLAPDETFSFWQIREGFWQIPSRQWMTFPAYSYLLWLDTKLLGTSEVALRIPSLVAMLIAARLVYASCRELLHDDRSAFVGLIFFCAHPAVAFTAIDARPHAFAVLATSLAIYATLKFRGTASIHQGIILGCACGLIVWFHFLFAVIIPGLFVCMITPLHARRVAGWRAVWVALATFAIIVSPALNEITYTFATRQTHVTAGAPGFLSLIYVAFPSLLMLAVPLMIVPAEGLWLSWPRFASAAMFAVMMGIIPVGILFSISTLTSVPVFLSRYTLVAVPGLAICWALLARVAPQSWGRFLLACLLLGLGIVPQLQHGPVQERRSDIRGGLHFADSRAQKIGGPIVLCSQFVESNVEGMPMPKDPKNAKLFSPLSFYPVHAEVVPLPQLLNKQTIDLGTRFLRMAIAQQRPFVVVGGIASRPVLDWFAQQASGAYDIQRYPAIGEVLVAEFTPRSKTR